MKTMNPPSTWSQATRPPSGGGSGISSIGSGVAIPGINSNFFSAFSVNDISSTVIVVDVDEAVEIAKRFGGRVSSYIICILF